MFKRSKIALAVAGVLALVGCDSYEPSQAEIDRKMQKMIADEANKDVLGQLSKERTELDQMVAELKTEDPLIKDAYYSYNEQNEKTLNIVREEDDDSGSVMVHSISRDTLHTLL